MEERLSPKTIKKIYRNQKRDKSLSSYATRDEDLTINPLQKKRYPTPLRNNSIIDIERVLNFPLYSRYKDKTQVYSLYKNDDITRRSLHVQLVSRSACDIGRALGLNTNLIESIALSHDLGHTPFGHLGEYVLDKVLYENCKKHFLHNTQSVRVVYNVFPLGLTLQTLDGMLTHNGEFEIQGIHPFDSSSSVIKSFEQLEDVLQQALDNGEKAIKHFIPSTLEGAVVRFADIISYLGKDRNDAYRIERQRSTLKISNGHLFTNSEIIKYLSEDIVENSFGKDYITLSNEGFNFIKKAKKENFIDIYNPESEKGDLGDENSGKLLDVMRLMFKIFLKDLEDDYYLSPIFRHHINYIARFQKDEKEYISYYLGDKNHTRLCLIVADYIASMTDSYFTELTELLFPDLTFSYRTYFNKDDDRVKSYIRRIYEYR